MQIDKMATYSRLLVFLTKQSPYLTAVSSDIKTSKRAGYTHGTIFLAKENWLIWQSSRCPTVAETAARYLLSILCSFLRCVGLGTVQASRQQKLISSKDNSQGKQSVICVSTTAVHGFYLLCTEGSCIYVYVCFSLATSLWVDSPSSAQKMGN